MSLDRQLNIIAGILRNNGLPGLKLTLLGRNPQDPEGWILKTNDDIDEVINTLQVAKIRPEKPLPI